MFIMFQIYSQLVTVEVAIIVMPLVMVHGRIKNVQVLALPTLLRVERAMLLVVTVQSPSVVRMDVK